MKITNTLDYARDIAVDGGFIPVDAGGTVDLSDHLALDDARALAESLSEQDGWSAPGKARAVKKQATKAAVAAEPDPPVADEPVNEENPDGS